MTVMIDEKMLPAAEAYDFSRPTTLAREHSRVLSMAFETFARQWGTQLTAKVRVKTQITSESVLMMTYDEYSSGLPGTTAMVLCSLEGLEARAVIQFPIPSALSWVSHMMGGHGGQPTPDRPFTAIEQGIVKHLMEDALEDLRYSFGPLLSLPVALESIQYNSQFAQAAAPANLMIVAAFTVQVGETSAAATMAFPAPALLPQMGADSNDDTSAGSRELIREQLMDTPVEVVMQLETVIVRPVEVLNLAVGDIIALPHTTERPFNITVDGIRLATASAGTNGSRLAAIIVTTEEKTR
ncbi:MAG TPA: flagellar motor switch protein FliM [Arthrobacter sp.]